MEVFLSKEEIKETVWSCDPMKASSTDVFNLNFIRKMWSEIRNDFYKIIEDFFADTNLKGSNIM